jgi:hypothetical protein
MSINFLPVNSKTILNRINHPLQSGRRKNREFSPPAPMNRRPKSKECISKTK